jgi:hypothetical protein
MQARLWISAEDAQSWHGDTLEESGAREEVIFDVSAEDAVRRALRGEAAFAQLYPTGC